MIQNSEEFYKIKASVGLKEKKKQLIISLILELLKIVITI